MSQNTPQQLHHQPVLLEDVLALLRPKKGETYLDLTAGYGGHAKAVLSEIGDASYATLVDRDENAIRELRELEKQGARIMHMDFTQAAKQLHAEGKGFDMILADLGVSSPQLDRAERGFAFKTDGPLDMRMDQRQELTASDIVNRYPADALTRIIREYGEEPPSRSSKIAKAIVYGRPIKSTVELATVIQRAIRGPRTKTHPATRTFQAIRIAVNQELELIKELLPLIPKLLKPGGRVVVMSFHSLEDRLVKNYFNEQARAGYEAEIQLLTKKPIGGEHELVHHPRSRSVKLRGAVKINNERT
jgi:16S rRNA (cytosine1402-N4)-methyltransferase